MKTKSQCGYINDGLGKALAGAFIISTIVSAIVGWAIIEGLVWVVSHISIGLKP